MKIKSRKIKMDWTLCNVSGCTNHKVVCFHCKRIDQKACPEHSKAHVQIGNYFYCINRQICFKKELYPKSIYEYPKPCQDYACCVVCQKNTRVGKCFGPTIFSNHPCPHEYEINECTACSGWAVGFDKETRCSNCYQEYIVNHTCPNCNHTSTTQFQCSGCKRKVCELCDKKTTIDISPVTLYGHGLCLGVYTHRCTTCMQGKTINGIQDEYRQAGY